MEILNTYNDAGFTGFLTVISGLITLFFLGVFIAALCAREFGISIIPLVFTVVFGAATVDASSSTIEYTEAIVTDWNEVYEQGYEVVEQNGKIVTLRKVDD